MKIYTKGGDKGKTSLLSGTRVPKYHIRVETYGTIDELSSLIGLLRSFDIDAKIKNDLIEIQRKLFDISGILACDKGKFIDKINKIQQTDIAFLEERIDFMTEKLPPMRYFILPGGQTETAIAHLCRTSCRKAERLAVKLFDTEKIFDENLVIYLNRLSDYFFVLARFIARAKGYEQIKV